MTLPMGEDMVELADRCELAIRPCREIDTLIWLAVTPGATRRETVVPANDVRRGWTIDETREAGGRLIVVPAYSASIDAALSLVANGCEWKVEWTRALNNGASIASVRLSSGLGYHGCGDTPALALTAASLRARAAITAALGEN